MSAACTALGHRYRFAAVDTVMTWTCERCASSDSKTYPSAADAARYAAAFDESAPQPRRGRMVPLGLLPLAIVRWWRARRTEEA